MIVLGTGRCGTSSAATWLDMPHEPKFNRRYPVPGEAWKLKKQYPYGWVSFANILLLPELENEELMLLVRDKDKVVESLYQFDTGPFQRLLPDFNFDTREGCGKYYDWYNDTVLEYDPIVISPEQIPHQENVGVLGLKYA